MRGQSDRGRRCQCSLITIIILGFCSSTSAVAPPLPLLPIPSAAQLRWQLGEMALFLHFGTNTFTDSEWGSGRADPSVFSPDRLNATQWAHVAASAGFSRILLTVKHHDGFCLWPSQYTNYSVASSSWRGGRGDVLADAAAAAKAAGIGLGVYLSPWDRHEECFGNTVKYNEFYIGQMTELLTGYGEIKQVFLDGAKGEGEKDMDYYFKLWFSVIKQLQPGSTIFSDAGPDTRWVGDESGFAGSTSWSPFNKSGIVIGGDLDLQYSLCGDPNGQDWVPSECDVSIRPGWFWHPSERPKSATTLLDLYYKSVGRNCHLLLNVPPNSSGLISEEDIQVLEEFKELKRIIFSDNLAKHALVIASTTRGGWGSQYEGVNILKEGLDSYWAPVERLLNWVLYVNLPKPVEFNVLLLQEPIQMGQRIMEFHIDVFVEGKYRTIVNGTTVGYKRLLQFENVVSNTIKLTIDKSRSDPLIAYLGVYLDPFFTLEEHHQTFPHPDSAGSNNGNEVSGLELNSVSLDQSASSALK